MRTIAVPVGVLKRLAIALVVAVLLVFGWRSYADGYWPFAPSEDQWTGVFLTNGQAYFGHFYATPGDYAHLRDVYYVLATQLQVQDSKAAPQTQLSVQRLGGEIHGPNPDMLVSKQQILFLEELRGDSPLVRTIAQLKSGTTQPAAAPTATPTPTATP